MAICSDIRPLENIHFEREPILHIAYKENEESLNHRLAETFFSSNNIRNPAHALHATRVARLKHARSSAGFRILYLMHSHSRNMSVHVQVQT